MKNFTRFLALMLAVLFAVGTISIFATDLADTADSLYADEIDTVTSLGIMDSQYGVFQPTAKVARWKFVVYAVKALTGIVDDATWNGGTNTTTFTDVSGKLGLSAVSYAVSLDLIKGRSETIFDPTTTITMAEATTIMVRALGYDYDVRYNAEQPDSWKWAYLAKAMELGVVDGLAADALDPDHPVTKEEAALIIYNTLFITRKNGSTISDKVWGGIDEYADTALTQLVVMSAQAKNAKNVEVSATLIDNYAIHTTGYVKLNGFINGKVDDTYTLYMSSADFKAYTGYTALDIVEKGYVGASVDVAFIGDSIESMSLNAPTIKKGLSGTATFDGTAATFVDETFETAGADLYVGKTDKYKAGYPVYREDGVYKMSGKGQKCYGVNNEEVYDYVGGKFFLDFDNNIVAEWVSDINSTAYAGVIVSGQYGKFASAAEISTSTATANANADGNYRHATDADMAKAATVFEENKDSTIANATDLAGIKATLARGSYTATVFDDDGDGEADRIFIKGTDYTEIIGRMVGGDAPKFQYLVQDADNHYAAKWVDYADIVKQNSDKKLDKLDPKVNYNGTSYDSFKALAAVEDADYFVALLPTNQTSTSLEILEWIPYQYGQIVNLAEVVNPTSNYQTTATIGIKDRDTGDTTNYFVDIAPKYNDKVVVSKNGGDPTSVWPYYYDGTIGVGVAKDVEYLSVTTAAGKILADRTVVVSQWVRFISRDVSAIKTIVAKGDDTGKISEREDKNMILYINKMEGSSLDNMIYISSDITTPSAATFTVLDPSKAEIKTVENVNLVDTVFNNSALAWLYKLRTNLSIKAAGDFAYSTDGKAFAGYAIDELWASEYKDVVEYVAAELAELADFAENKYYTFTSFGVQAEEDGDDYSWLTALYEAGNAFVKEGDAYVALTTATPAIGLQIYKRALVTAAQVTPETYYVIAVVASQAGLVDATTYAIFTEFDGDETDWTAETYYEKDGDNFVLSSDTEYDGQSTYYAKDATEYTGTALKALEEAEYEGLLDGNTLGAKAQTIPEISLDSLYEATEDMSHKANLLYLTFKTDGVGKFYTVSEGTTPTWTETNRAKTAETYKLLTDTLIYKSTAATSDFYFKAGENYSVTRYNKIYSKATNEGHAMTYKTKFGTADEPHYETAKSYTFTDESAYFEPAYKTYSDFDEYTVDQTRLLPYYEGEDDDRHIAGYYEFFAGTVYSVSRESLVQKASNSQFVPFTTEILNSLKDKKGNLPETLTKTDKTFTGYQQVDADGNPLGDGKIYKIDGNKLYEYTPAGSEPFAKLSDATTLTSSQLKQYAKIPDGYTATKTFISRGKLVSENELLNTTDHIGEGETAQYLYAGNDTFTATQFDAAVKAGVAADSFTAIDWSGDIAGISVTAAAKTYTYKVGSSEKTDTRYTYTVTSDATGNTAFLKATGINYDGKTFTGLMSIDNVSVGAYNDDTKFVVVEPQNITVNSDASAYTQAQGYTFTSYTAAQIEKMSLSVHEYRADFKDNKGNGKTATYVVIFGNVIPGDTGTVTLTECQNATVAGLELGTTKSIPTGTTSYTVSYDSETYPILVVKVNGTAVTVDENGKFSFKVEKDKTYNISVIASEEPVDMGTVNVTKNADTDKVMIGDIEAKDSQDLPVGTYTITVTPKEGSPIITARVNREYVQVTGNSFTLTVEKDETYDVEITCSASIRVYLNSPVNAVLTTNTDGELVWTWTTAENKAIDIFSTETLSGSVYESYVWNPSEGYPTHIYDANRPGVYTVVYDPDPNGTGTYRLIDDVHYKDEDGNPKTDVNVYVHRPENPEDYDPKETDKLIAQLLKDSAKLSTGAFYGTEATNTILFFDLFCKQDDQTTTLSYANRVALEMANFKFVSFTAEKGFTVIDATKFNDAEKVNKEDPTAYNFLPWNSGDSYASGKWGTSGTTAQLAAVTDTPRDVSTITFKYTLAADGKIIVFVNTTTNVAAKSGK